MVLPILLGAAAASAAVFGAKEGAEAVLNNTLAGLLRHNVQADYDTASTRLSKTKTRTADTLELLGKQKLSTWDKRLGRFVHLYGRLKNVQISGHVAVGEFETAHFSREELAEMKKISFQSHEALLGGASALGTGVLAGVASYGGAMMFATASTGTAIGTLSGAAATNATLAWFGGGSLASGGLGMAGGMLVLGGLVTGPILAVGGMVMNSKSEENLTQARADVAQAEKCIEDIKHVVATLETIEKVAQASHSMIIRLGALMDDTLNALEQLLQYTGVDYSMYGIEHKQIVYSSVQCAQMLKLVLETPLLTPAGALDPQLPLALKQAETFEVDVAINHQEDIDG